MRAIPFLVRAIPFLVIVLGVGIQYVDPGRPVYQTGWYDVVLAAAAIVGLRTARRWAREEPHHAVRALAMAIGGVIVAIAGIASGLFAPAPRTVIGAPGERVPVSGAGGTLLFPVLARDGSSAVPIFARAEGPAVPIEYGRTHYFANVTMRAVARTVVLVSARDAGGAHLTVTQPTGNVFLSPVLLMQQQQMIAGLRLPFDTFAVPAKQRLVDILLFSPEQTARMHGTHAIGNAVLFAVADIEHHTLPHGIAFAPAGREIVVAGLRLRARVVEYPAVAVAWIPSIPVALMGALVLALGMAVQPRRLT